MFNTKTFIITAALTVFSAAAHAGFFVEPRVGYQTGTFDGAGLLDDLTIITVDDKTSGMGIGGLLGYQFKTFSFGLEGLVSNLSNEDKDTEEKTDFTTQDLGLFLRWDWGRFHLAAVFLSSTAKDESLKNNGMDENLSGNGMRFGIGYRFFQHVSVNLDFIAVDYDKADEPSVIDLKGERNTTMVGVSFPFGLDGK